MITVIVKYFLPFSLTEKTDTINAVSEISNPSTEKAPGTTLSARANNANAIASQPVTMLISAPNRAGERICARPAGYELFNF